MQYRQGDVFLELIERLPVGTKPIKSLVLAEGEVTGHAHRVCGGRAKLFGDEAGSRFLRVVSTVAVAHEEHGEILLPPGVYQVTRQREYSPEASRNVAD